MRAVRYDRFGGPEVLEIAEVPEPHAGPGTVRIRVHAAGVNPADGKMREGRFAGGKPLPAPAGVGLEAAGIVDEIGDGVTGVEIGDRVFGGARGAAAEFAVLRQWAAVPRHVSLEEAGATPVSFETAVRMLGVVDAVEGDTVVISGAAGGVGSALIQLAKAGGMIAIGTASAENQGYVEALGALPTTYDDGWVDRVRALAVAEVNVGLDVAGAGVLPDLIALTGDPNRVVTIADPTASEHGVVFTSGGGDAGAAYALAARMFEDGTLRTIVEHRYAFEAVADAQAFMAQGHARGRTVLVITEED